LDEVFKKPISHMSFVGKLTDFCYFNVVFKLHKIKTTQNTNIHYTSYASNYKQVYNFNIL